MSLLASPPILSPPSCSLLLTCSSVAREEKRSSTSFAKTLISRLSQSVGRISLFCARGLTREVGLRVRARVSVYELEKDLKREGNEKSDWREATVKVTRHVIIRNKRCESAMPRLSLCDLLYDWTACEESLRTGDRSTEAGLTSPAAYLLLSSLLCSLTCFPPPSDSKYRASQACIVSSSLASHSFVCVRQPAMCVCDLRVRSHASH